jgi:hypothetical protein
MKHKFSLFIFLLLFIFSYLISFAHAFEGFHDEDLFQFQWGGGWYLDDEGKERAMVTCNKALNGHSIVISGDLVIGSNLLDWDNNEGTNYIAGLGQNVLEYIQQQVLNNIENDVSSGNTTTVKTLYIKVNKGGLYVTQNAIINDLYFGHLSAIDEDYAHFNGWGNLARDWAAIGHQGDYTQTSYAIAAGWWWPPHYLDRNFLRLNCAAGENHGVEFLRNNNEITPLLTVNSIGIALGKRAEDYALEIPHDLELTSHWTTNLNNYNHHTIFLNTAHRKAPPVVLHNIDTFTHSWARLIGCGISACSTWSFNSSLGIFAHKSIDFTNSASNYNLAYLDLEQRCFYPKRLVLGSRDASDSQFFTNTPGFNTPITFEVAGDMAVGFYTYGNPCATDLYPKTYMTKAERKYDRYWGARIHFNGVSLSTDPIWMGRYDCQYYNGSSPSIKGTTLAIHVGDDFEKGWQPCQDFFEIGIWDKTNASSDKFNTLIKIGARGLANISDVHFKKHIRNLPQALNKISKINAVFFNWKNQTNPTNKEVGFIAQDIEPVFPNLVETHGNSMKMVNYFGFLPYMVEAIKEQETKINLIQSKINQLKQKLKEINNHEN